MSRFRIYFGPDLSQFTPYQRNLSAALSQLGKEINVIGLPLGVRSLLKLLVARCDVLHVHWPSYYYLFPSSLGSWSRAICFHIILRILKLRGTRIIWTAHNIHAHDPEQARVEAWFMRRFVKLVEHFIIHCQYAHKLLQDAYGEIECEKISVIPHGHYLDNYTPFQSQQLARSKLQLNESTFLALFLGHIRLYKGVPELLAAFNRLKDSSAALVVAGRVWDKSLERVLANEASHNAQIIFRPGFITEDVIPVYFAAADVVVFPYQNVLTSGAVILAMSLGKPCIAPRVGCITEALGKEGGCLYDPEDPSGLFKAIKKAHVERDRLEQMGRNNANRALAWNWHDIARQTYDVYVR